MSEPLFIRPIQQGCIQPSAALTLPSGRARYFRPIFRPPDVGDVVYGVVERIGQHSTLENISGRIHTIYDGTRALFVFGNRYAPDYFEGVVPSAAVDATDLLARSGMVGEMRVKNAAIKDPTRIRLEGYVCDKDGNVLNTRSFSLVQPRTTHRQSPRAKMILVCGTSMNSGKSMAAAACCWALRCAGRNVRASKVTGTASLKDILKMNDAGARPYSDFSFLGYPSTYMLTEAEVLDIFTRLDLKYGNNPRNYWVVELADGVNQRETAMLLASREVRERIDTLVFCARDAFSAVGGLRMLKETFDLVPHLMSGICSSSPLHIRELKEFTTVPVFESADPDVNALAHALLRPKKRRRIGLSVH